MILEIKKHSNLIQKLEYYKEVKCIEKIMLVYLQNFELFEDDEIFITKVFEDDDSVILKIRYK